MSKLVTIQDYAANHYKDRKGKKKKVNKSYIYYLISIGKQKNVEEIGKNKFIRV